MQKIIILLIGMVFLAGCSGKNNLSDAYGNFETVEYLISAEGQGKILRFELEEGSVLSEGEIIGYIDTVPLHLQRQQLLARIGAVESQRSGIRTQIDVLKSQKKNLLVEKARLDKLLADGAATRKQMDNVEGQLNTLDAQIMSVQSKYETIRAEILAFQSQIKITENQLNRNTIVNPIGGTVLEKYAEAYELAIPGKALYKIANLETMILRVYISGAQLTSLKLGQEVKVIIDDPESIDVPLTGKITWIAGKSEFTPKIIQTREERVNLVYAVKVEVPNDGRLKIGMPGEVIL